MVAATVVTLTGSAQATDIAIPFDGLLFGDPGSVVLVATVDVAADQVDQTCNLVVLAENQSSVHPGNDLIVSTGSSQAVIFGVEDTANGGTSESYEMLLGPTIDVELRIGQDGMSSLGFDLSFDCTKPLPELPTIGEQLVTATTTPSTTTPTTTSTSTAATPTTTCSTGSATASGASSTVASETDCCAPAATTGSASGSGTDCCEPGSTTGSVTDCCAAAASTGAVTTGCAEVAVTTTTVPPTTTTTAVPATVAGAATNLPATPAAEAVGGSPSYTG